MERKTQLLKDLILSTVDTLAIIDSELIVNIDHSIDTIMESTKNENILINSSRTNFLFGILQ